MPRVFTDDEVTQVFRVISEDPTTIYEREARTLMLARGSRQMTIPPPAAAAEQGRSPARPSEQPSKPTSSVPLARVPITRAPVPRRALPPPFRGRIPSSTVNDIVPEKDDKRSR